MTLPSEAQQLLETFQPHQSWEQKMRLLMQLGKTLPPFNPADKTDNNLIKGCESQVWLTSTHEKSLYNFNATSEAKIIQGLLAVLLKRINGLTQEEIKQIDLEDWFQQLGLSKQLSSSRRDGLRAIFQRIKTTTS